MRSFRKPLIPLNGARYKENRTWPNFSLVFCLVCLLFWVPTWSRAILGPQNPLVGIYFNGRGRVENWAPSAG